LLALIVTPEPPWPVVDGWAVRHCQLIRSMAAFSEVDVVTLAAPFAGVDAGEARRQLKAKSFTVVRHSPPSNRIAALKSLVTSAPMCSLLYHSEPLRHTLASMSARKRYDVCLVLGDISMARYGAAVRADMHLLDICDDQGLKCDRRAQVAANTALRAYYRRQAKMIRAYLRRISTAFTRIIAISEPDALSLERVVGVGVKVVTVPNGVDVDLFRPANSCVSGTSDPRLLFVGAMRSWPNRDAVEWFRASVAPHILDENPSARLHVVGSGSDQLRTTDPVLVLHGFAEDLPSEYRACDVFVCPLRVGAGVKNKLIEALASGCAVVSTDVGIEGLDVRNGEQLLVANDPVEFAHAVNRLLRDPELRARLGRAARAFAERSLSLEAVRKSLQRALLPNPAGIEHAGYGRPEIAIVSGL
jgi:polysaccharide biosynthesis protein PslH